MLQFNNKALTHSFPPSATGTNRHILLGFIATDGGAAPLVPHHVPVSHQAKVILSLCLSHLDRDPGLLDVLAKAFAGTQPTTLPSSSSSSRGVPPHHDQATPASPTGNPESSRQVKPRPTHLPPHTPSIADCLARRHDWSDLGLQADLAINVRDYMAPGQCDLLATALEKIKAPVGSSFSKFWRKAAAWHRYDALASIVACSTYSRSLDFIHCGDGRFSCQDRMLCPRCCYNFMARRVDEELGGSFTRTARGITSCSASAATRTRRGG